VRNLRLSDEPEPFLFIPDVVMNLPRAVVLQVDPDVVRVENIVDLLVLFPNALDVRVLLLGIQTVIDKDVDTVYDLLILVPVIRLLFILKVNW
jgi:hypothetical protein